MRRKLFYQFFSSHKDIDYWLVDLNPNMFGVKKSVDITNITFENNSFDMIVCNRVLEHIPDDKKAMQELYRVLKPKDGLAFINVPLSNRQTTLENPEYNTPELRLKFYGQEDHVRYYGFDYVDRLKAAGFNVIMFTMSDIDESLIKKYGLDRNEKIFLCRK